MADHLLALPSGFDLYEYQVLRLLGSGGFGITYLSYDTNLSKPVAIKEYLPIDLAVRPDGVSVVPKSQQDRTSYDWGLERFLDEARTLARFKHPNIIQVHRYFQAHGTGYIVMEFAEGETLAAHIKRNGPLTESALKALLLPILDGLAEVHGINFLHRDIKPGNIIIRKNGSPVLLDFGAARQAVGAKSRSVTAIVTPGYAPIEQYSSKGRQGPWTDIYALGAVAYCCISGSPPPDAADRILEDTMSPLSTRQLSGYSRPFLAAIDAALAVREKDRPANIDQWRTRLAGPAAATAQQTPAVSAAVPVAAPAPDPDATVLATKQAITDVRDVSIRHEPRERIAAEQPRRSMRWLAPTLGVILIAGIAGGGYWWTREHGFSLAELLPGGSDREVVPSDPRQRAIALEIEIDSQLQGIEGSIPSMQHQLAAANEERTRLEERIETTTNDFERATLGADLQRLTERERRLGDEIRLVQLWVRRDDELTHVATLLEDARTRMKSLDYAGAVTLLGDAETALGTMARTRQQLGDALDGRARFVQHRYEIESILAAESLGAIDADAAIGTLEKDGAKSLERGEFDAAARAFAQADEQVRNVAQAQVDRTVETLKTTAEAAIDRRDAPAARSAVDRAKRLVELRKRFQ